ncbi:hypothetical protein FB451DRAFT_1047101 [Mycena latifolia]|nr:hypothetical protein FB451DRAFT_1047101 [Mycena latifolia]
MARAWPYIEQLCLTGFPHPRGTNTLLGIYSLAEHCPFLHTLEMAFDASRIPQLVPQPGHRVLQESLVSFDVLYSPISDAFAVARFLSFIFGDLKEVMSDDDPGDDDDPQALLAGDYHRRWTEVERMLPGFGEVRDEEWSLGNDSANSVLQNLFEY